MVPALASDSSARSLTSGSDSEGNPFTTPSHLRSASLNNGSGYFGAQPPQISQPRTPGSLSRKSSMKRSGSMPVYARSPSMSFLGPSFIAEKQRPIFKSQLLDEAATTEKPWLQAKSPKPGRISYGLFLAGVFLGIAGGAYILYTGYAQVDRGNYCPILNDDFSSGSLNSAYWQAESSIGGGPTDDFVWFSDSATNHYVADGALNIVPSLTSDATDLQSGISNTTYLDLGQYCTISTDADCIISSATNSSITIPPVRSASLTTRGKIEMKYGRVEIEAKMPTGDWLWPRISLVPVGDVYGAFPASGQIDIIQSKGNLATKQKDALNNAAQSGLHWGPAGMVTEDRYWITNAVRRARRKFFNEQYYTFGVDWTEEKIFVWYKTRNFGMFNLNFRGKTTYQRGEFATLTTNGTVIPNPWADSEHPMIAPFDQSFFLRLQVAAGGLDGYFIDDNEDDKPWKNTQTRSTAMANFATKSDAWLPSWGTAGADRGLQIKSVKMWQKC